MTYERSTVIENITKFAEDFALDLNENDDISFDLVLDNGTSYRIRNGAGKVFIIDVDKWKRLQDTYGKEPKYLTPVKPVEPVVEDTTEIVLTNEIIKELETAPVTPEPVTEPTIEKVKKPKKVKTETTDAVTDEPTATEESTTTTTEETNI